MPENNEGGGPVKKEPVQEPVQQPEPAPSAPADLGSEDSGHRNELF